MSPWYYSRLVFFWVKFHLPFVAMVLCIGVIVATTHAAAYYAGHNAGATAALIYCGR